MNKKGIIVSVYKTNLSETSINQLPPMLNTMSEIIRWNTDIEDCDKILKIESHTNISMRVEQKLQYVGISCEELKD